jgi:hypothetical protein
LAATGLSANPDEYRQRLEEHSDEQIDAWCIELLRDVSVWLGVRRVLREFMQATGIDEQGLERVYATGGGAPATLGRTAEGEVMVPAISLHYLVPGLHAQLADARGRLTNYLVANFREIAYV